MIETNLETLQERARHAKLVAMDLDGTLLTSKRELTDANSRALRTLADRGVVLAIATGRSRSSIPDTISSLYGVRYLITANGSKIFATEPEELVYEKYIMVKAIEYIAPFFSDDEVMCEVFWDGAPHVEESRFEAARDYGVPRWFSDYFFSSRKPLKDFEAAVYANIDRLENINFVFGRDDVQERVRAFLSERTDLYELTSSFPFNYEIGGLGVSKGAAVDFIAKREGLLPSETLCIGDNHNDVKMIEYAGIGIAVENAVPAALAAADLITEDCDNSGVAAALKALGMVS
ncbi:MAG: Cof-type HAD-IIB family hydrolase [Clostridiales bacterium]|nr:Cof-type HAD-IIB family hydrolase [Clostridiales bacterium]